MSNHYLDIPLDYCEPLGGLRWSRLAEAIERDDGRIFAFTQEMLAFLEGFSSVRPLMDFGHVLHFWHLLRLRKSTRHDFTPLAMAWQESGRPPRTTGLVCAMLCCDVPNTGKPARPEELAGWLNVWARIAARPVMPGDEPALSPDAFEALIAQELTNYTVSELRHWFRFGAGPPRESDSLAEKLLAEKPRSLSQQLTEISKHDRLCGAVPFVGPLLGALSLPPRRLDCPEVPIGGYADVTTRGHPEAILAAQFALDEWEFLRRYASRELLYHRREDPAVRAQEELVLLLDQGVRTWGAVRLLLAASVFALGQMAQNRRLALRIALTSSDNSFDPVEIKADTLAERLSASDLSATPHQALAALVKEPATGPRDIVLLTHPYNRDDAATFACCKDLDAHCRLFALTAERSGQIELAEVRRGGIVPISRFRVEPVGLAPVRQALVQDSWSGDVEPVPCPFLHGLAGRHEPLQFAFDTSGEWLLVINPPATLLALRTDGTGYEILPRPTFRGAVLTGLQQVIGVDNGFVVVTTHPPRTIPSFLGGLGRLGGLAGDSYPIAAHYHFPTRRCRVISFDLPDQPKPSWRYHKGDQAIAVMVGLQGRWAKLHGEGKEDVLPSRLRWSDAPPAQTDESGFSSTQGWNIPQVQLQAGVVSIRGIQPPARPFTPLEEGKPWLKEMTLERALCQGETLAMVVQGANMTKHLCVFNSLSGTLIGRLGLPYSHESFELSPDGKFLAVQRGQGQVQIREAYTCLTLRCVSPVGRFHNNLEVELGEYWLRMSVGGLSHVIDWGEGPLRSSLGLEVARQQIRDAIAAKQFSRAKSGAMLLPKQVAGDHARFRGAAPFKLLTATVTSVGEVFLFDNREALIAGFFMFRNDLAGWMPNGCRWGAEGLLGRAVTPNAAEHIAAALRSVGQGRRPT